MTRPEEHRFPLVKRRAVGRSPDAGVYASLDTLIRLQFQAKGYSFLPRQPLHSLLAGRHASRVRGRGLDFEELRGYLPGDDTRTIDWRVTARAGKPFVRVFNEERDRPALLLVDQRLSMFYGTRVAMKSVTAAEAAALAAWRVFDAGDRVGAVVFDDTDVVEIRPHRSRQRVMAILRAIVEKNHALRADSDVPPDPGMLNRALERAVRVAKHDFLVTVISDFDGVDDETRRLMTLLAQHNDVLAARIYDPSRVEVPDSGRFVVSDGQLQVELESGDLERLSEYFQESDRAGVVALRKIGVPMLAISTAEEVAPQVRRQLGSR